MGDMLHDNYVCVDISVHTTTGFVYDWGFAPTGITPFPKKVCMCFFLPTDGRDYINYECYVFV